MSNSEWEYQVRRGLDHIYATHPKLKRHMANDKAIIEACNNFAGREVVPTPDLYDLALENPPQAKEESKPIAMDYQSQQHQKDVREEVAAQDQRSREVWVRDILPRFDVKDWEANYQMALTYCNGELSLSKFEFLVQNTPPGLKLVFGDERAELLAQIKERLYDPYGRRMTALDLKSQMLKYQYMDRMQLRAVLQNIIDRQATAKKPVHQIQSELAAVRKAETERPYPGYPTLQNTYVPKGQIMAVNTREYLNQIAKHDLEAFKHMVRIYSSTQVDDIRIGRRY